VVLPFASLDPVENGEVCIQCGPWSTFMATLCAVHRALFSVNTEDWCKLCNRFVASKLASWYVLSACLVRPRMDAGQWLLSWARSVAGVNGGGRCVGPTGCSWRRMPTPCRPLVPVPRCHFPCCL